MRARYAVGVPLAVAALVAAGVAAVVWAQGGPGRGLYSRLWAPDPVQAYWDPGTFYQAPETVRGSFEGPECIRCHQGVTPGIVRDWRASGHASPAGEREPVRCPACHGRDHQDLRLPDPQVCGGCHDRQHGQFRAERRFGPPSHALAMQRATNAPHFVDKPKAETAACVQCHSVATKCDSCHTRHRFDPAEARRPEACITCHNGPPHPDATVYFRSAHGQRYRANGDQWDWSQSLADGNYPAPTCAYCHMYQGKHQVADLPVWKFGLKEVNPDTSANAVKRRGWLRVCDDCHDRAEARQALERLDRERERAWDLLYAGEDVLEDLRADGLLFPPAGQRPRYPLSLLDRVWPRARIGKAEGQAAAFYNVSRIERMYFEMWYFDNLGAYKGAAHQAWDFAAAKHRALKRDLQAIREEGRTLRRLGQAEREGGGSLPDPGPFWLEGPYTGFNRENN